METRRLARTELASCIDPIAEPSLVGPTPWLDELQAAVEEAASGRDGSSPHSQSIWRPLDGFAEAAVGIPTGNYLSDKRLPYHRPMALTSNRSESVAPGMDYEDSRCFLFDYDAEPGSIPDPHGCGLFRRSFSRLKALRQCIVGELESSEKWLQYRRLASGGEPAEDEVEIAKQIREVIGRYINPTILDANSRADEMVKYVAFKDWSSLESGIIGLVNRKIAETISEFALEPQTVDQVRVKCFMVEEDSYSTLHGEAKVLKRALPCQSLMWDTTEVSGLPHKPMSNGPSNYDQRLRAPASVRADFTETPPVCGRIAVALMQRPITRAAKGYSPTTCLVGMMSWKGCMSLSTFNCICAEKCWVSALKQACHLGTGCCGDYAKIRRYNSIWASTPAL